MQPEQLTKQYLDQVKIMQLATSVDDQPWACTVHYYVDKDLNFYWVSNVGRKHSQDIAQNPKVAVTVMVHENTPEEKYVIGISVQGAAELVEPAIAQDIVEGYIRKHGKDSNMDDIVSGINAHKFYRLKPSSIVLFDTKDFPDNPRQELSLNA